MLVPPGRLVPPPMGDPGSALDNPKYLDQFLMILQLHKCVNNG